MAWDARNGGVNSRTMRYACLEYWFDPDYSKRAAPSAHGGIYTGGVRW